MSRYYIPLTARLEKKHVQKLRFGRTLGSQKYEQTRKKYTAVLHKFSFNSLYAYTVDVTSN